ncbi:MAG: hypothetical protein H7Y11_13200, partial [Armatimonadetes bacterium]|nr:hypothetical protein [Anaerolineae bacterium]
AADGQPYDYETQVLHLAHRYDDRDLAPSWVTALAGIPGTALARPMDCMQHEGWLLIAEGGDAARHSAIHVWRR